MTLYRHDLTSILSKGLTGCQARHINTLAGIVYSLVKGKEVRLSATAVEQPLAGKEESRIMKLRRLLANSALEWPVYYLPFIQSSWTGF